VHNDVKPDNILFDEDGSLKLIDFGISLRREPDRDRLRPGAPAGSPGYVAPEVKRGGWPRVESDLFAVGVVLREMLVGAVGDERGAAPGAAEAEETRGIPAALEPVLTRLLAEEPEQRYPSAHAAAAALHEAREGLVLERAVTLDVEGTLVPSFRDRRPREGLAEFMTFCLDHFDRIFVYTLLAREEARDVFEELAGWHPAAARFLDRYEYVVWPRGEDGSFKDLRRCRVALEQNALVDDMIEWVPEDQAHRWVKVQNCDDVAGFDRGLAHAEQTLRARFGLPEGEEGLRGER
jgi:protein kinase-like protein